MSNRCLSCGADLDAWLERLHRYLEHGVGLCADRSPAVEKVKRLFNSVGLATTTAEEMERMLNMKEEDR